jgi:Mn-dependent DtxR family transcriptional regulator
LSELEAALFEKGGIVPDVQIAEELGVSKSWVSAKRKRLGIPKAVHRRKVNRRFSQIVEFLNDQYEPLRTSAIGEALGIDRPTLQRDLASLLAMGKVYRIDDGQRGDSEHFGRYWWVSA